MPAKTNWVTVETFNDTHGLNFNTIYVMKNQKLIPDSVCMKHEGILYVDERYFRSRKEFKRRVQLYSHDVYYYIREHFNDRQIAQLIELYDPSINFNNMYTFLKNDFFLLDIKTIVTQKVTKNQWKFFKFARFFMRKMRVYLTKVPVDLNIILDRRMITEYPDKKLKEVLKK